MLFAILLGVYPRALLDYTTPTIDRTVDDLTTWTRHQPVVSEDPAPEDSATGPAADRPGPDTPVVIEETLGTPLTPTSVTPHTSPKEHQQP